MCQTPHESQTDQNTSRLKYIVKLFYTEKRLLLRNNKKPGRLNNSAMHSSRFLTI